MKRLLALLFVALLGTAAHADNVTLQSHAFAIGKGPGISGYTALLCGAGTLPIGQTSADPQCIALSGDATISAAGVLTLASVNANVGSFGSATQCPAVTVNAKGLITAASQTACTPAVGSVTGLGTGIATALGHNVGTAGAPVLFNGALGTPSSGVVATGVTLGPVTPGFGGDATGDIYYRNSGGVLARLAVGGTGTVLTGGSTPSWTASSTAGGFVNKFRNATLAIAQRGTTVTIGTTGNYGPDGWKIFFAGSANVSAVARSGDAASNGGSVNDLQILGATSNTDIKAAQRIESYDAAPLAGQTVTVQWHFLQSSGSSVTPKISTCFASIQDNFGTCTSDLASVSVSACANNVWCTEAYTFTASASAVNGYEVDIDCNAGFTGAQSCIIGSPDIRVTTGATPGVNTSPPTPELRPIQSELAQCLRFFATNYDFNQTPGSSQTATPGGMASVMGFATPNYPGISIPFPVPMRAAPASISFWDRAGNASVISQFYNTTGLAPAWHDNIAVGTGLTLVPGMKGFIADAAGAGLVFYSFFYTASAEL